jgi:aromatic ring hydroxylase
MQPSDIDLHSAELRPYLDRYMRGAGVDVEYKSRLYRLGTDLTLSTFSNRQELYEYWHGGDPTRNRTNVFLRHDRSWLTERVHQLLQEIGDAADN